jgi:DNA replication and repair protein RecF
MFDRGWAVDTDLADALERDRPTELMRGQTLAGPHRADLALMRDGRRLRLSRGQAKVAVCLLQLAAERVHQTDGLPPTVWLLDDIDAELDPSTAGRLWGLFDDPAVQGFVTRVAGAADVAVEANSSRGARFHVEHGTLMSPFPPASCKPPMA